MRTLIRITAALLFSISIARADTLIDPTRPAFAPAKATQSTSTAVQASRVTAIFQSGERRVAVLDGRVVKAGDRVGDVTIQEILPDGVRYTRAGHSEIARLPQQAAAVRTKRIRQEISP